MKLYFINPLLTLVVDSGSWSNKDQKITSECWFNNRTATAQT